jgi:hypothetical protein
MLPLFPLPESNHQIWFPSGSNYLYAATEQFLAATEKDFHLVRFYQQLNHSDAESGVFHQVVELEFAVHIVGYRTISLHCWKQGFPFFQGNRLRVPFGLAGCSFRLPDGFASGCRFGFRRRPVIVNPVAGIALYSNHFLPNHGNNSMIHDFTALRAMGLYNISCRQLSDNHSLCSLIYISQGFAI